MENISVYGVLEEYYGNETNVKARIDAILERTGNEEEFKNEFNKEFPKGEKALIQLMRVYELLVEFYEREQRYGQLEYV